MNSYTVRPTVRISARSAAEAEARVREMLGEADSVELNPADTELVTHRIQDAQEMEVDRLTQVAVRHGWGTLDLRELFGITSDRCLFRTISGVIRQAIEEGDDPEWIEKELTREGV